MNKNVKRNQEEEWKEDEKGPGLGVGRFHKDRNGGRGLKRGAG